MFFRNAYLSDDVESIKSIDTSNDVSNGKQFELELDFVKQYNDMDGIGHIKTVFNHDDLYEQDMWEVFDTKDGSNSLELLLQDYI